jgi:3-dehydroquinate synthase
MEIVKVDLGEASYPIYIGSGLLSDASILTPHIKGEQVCIVSNTTVGPIYRGILEQTLSGKQLDYLEIADGEQFKTLDTFNLIITHLLENRHERTTTLVALGGGVVGDITGFAAACYLRGVNYIQVPTTLLAQVDSSVGGKTAVNHALGKNLVGAFNQPECVLIDTDTLITLPERELKAGMAEVIKHAAIRDGNFLKWLEENLAELLTLDKPALLYCVKRNCEIKAEIVAADEKEKNVRALLNMGHTFGHAIENAKGYGVWLHGEAVAAGCVMAADLSCRLGMLPADAGRRLKRLILATGLPVAPPMDIDPERFIELMRLDKKASFGEIRFVLLNELGEATLVANVNQDVLHETLQAGEYLCE